MLYCTLVNRREYNMNKCIKELALTCGAWHQVYDQKEFMLDSNFDVEKFAELIIKETMQVVRNNVAWNGYLNAAEAVIEHFGVEE
jgi:hypothetical protein